MEGRKERGLGRNAKGWRVYTAPGSLLPAGHNGGNLTASAGEKRAQRLRPHEDARGGDALLAEPDDHVPVKECVRVLRTDAPASALLAYE